MDAVEGVLFTVGVYCCILDEHAVQLRSSFVAVQRRIGAVHWSHSQF